jgi:hypothetical protein
VIQTTVSPQVSPIFQQAFQPTGSPMTAGTTQQAPVTHAADTGVSTPSPAPAPAMQPSGESAAYQRMIELLLAREAQAPVPAAPAPSYSAPPLPVMEETAPMPVIVPSPAPQTAEAPVAVVAPKASLPWLPFAIIGGGLFLVFAMRGKRK